MFYEHALAEIEGYVDNDGYAFWMIKSSKVELDEAREEVKEVRTDSSDDFEDVLDDGSLIPEEDLSDDEQSDETIVGVNVEGNVVSFKMEHPTSSSIIDSADSPVKKVQI